MDDLVEMIVKSLDDIHLIKLKSDAICKGEGAILKYLAMNNEAMSGELSDKLYVSTARVAAALNNLETKGYIVRTNSLNDKRKVLVKITSEGMDYYNSISNKVRNNIKTICNELGKDKVVEFINTSKEIKSILERIDKNV